MELYYENESDSDSDPASQSSQETFVGDEKRQYHNVLEQKRRNILKTNFDLLMEVIPSLKKKGFVINDKKASRAKILKAAIHAIKRAELKRPSRLQDIKTLEKDNASLEQYYLKLQEADETGDFSNVESIFRSIDELNEKCTVKEDSTDSEDVDSDDAESDPDNELEEEEDQEIDYSSDNCLEDESNNVSEESEATESDDSSEYSSSDNE